MRKTIIPETNFFATLAKSSREILWAFLTLLISFALSLHLFRETFSGVFKNRIPLAGDGLFTGIFLKIVIENSWNDVFMLKVNSPDYGWPSNLNFLHYPVGSLFEILTVKLFATGTGITDPAQLIHIFSILKAMPIALATYVACRFMRISPFFSLLAGIVFSSNTFNLVRAEGHFFLGLTWSIPLAIALIFLPFRAVMENRKLNLQEKAYLFCTAPICAFTGFYFLVFMVILSVVAVIYLVYYLYTYQPRDPYGTHVKVVLKNIKSSLCVVAVFCFGIISQTIPIIIQSKNLVSLVGPADRSPTEAIVYAGTFETLFYDLNTLFLKLLKREDLIAYLQTRISWEGSQVGAITGLFIIVIALIPIYLLIFPKNHYFQYSSLKSFVDEIEVRFLFIMLSISLLLYLVTPLNFLVSQLLPQIRAWGRVSVVISFVSIALITNLISRIPIKSIFSLSMSIVCTSLLLLGYSQQHLTRPVAAQLDESAMQKIAMENAVLNQLKLHLPINCSIVNLPFYPFPEFDRSDDNNIDYGQFALPIRDKGYFRWSYGGVKSTDSYRAWQPLVSEFPPFSRATIRTQILYAKASRACGALIDSSFLTKSEKSELMEFTRIHSECFVSLMERQNLSEQSLLLVNFQDPTCDLKESSDLIEFFRFNADSKVSWRIDQGSELGFRSKFQLFPATSEVSVRMKALNPGDFQKIQMLFQIIPIDVEKQGPIRLCITDIDQKRSECRIQILDLNGQTQMGLPNWTLRKNTLRLSVKISPLESTEVAKWGVTLSGK
jgi:hypothetical protein